MLAILAFLDITIQSTNESRRFSVETDRVERHCVLFKNNILKKQAELIIKNYTFK